MQTDRVEHIHKYQKNKNNGRELKELLEYYKFRIFVPLFSSSPVSQTITMYYYRRLKFHYNSIKKTLNISIEPTEETHTVSYGLSGSSCTFEGSLLRQFKDTSTLYQTQSKALEGLLSELKARFSAVSKSQKNSPLFITPTVITSSKNHSSHKNIKKSSHQTRFKNAFLSTKIQPFNQQNLFNDPFKSNNIILEQRGFKIDSSQKKITQKKPSYLIAKKQILERQNKLQLMNQFKKNKKVNEQEIKKEQNLNLRNTSSRNSLQKIKSNKNSLQKITSSRNSIQKIMKYRNSLQKSPYSRSHLKKEFQDPLITKRSDSTSKIIINKPKVLESAPVSPRRKSMHKIKVTDIQLNGKDNLFTMRKKKFATLKKCTPK